VYSVEGATLVETYGLGQVSVSEDLTVSHTPSVAEDLERRYGVVFQTASLGSYLEKGSGFAISPSTQRFRL
jgi:hypothetical protein